MPTNALDELAAALATNRRLGTATALPVDALGSRADANAVQLAALTEYGAEIAGYTVIGTNPATRSALGLGEPAFGLIADRALFRDGHEFRLPHGVIGAQCELLFTLGRNYPGPGETIDRRSAADAVVSCQAAIGILGRRTIAAPHNDILAIADFALHVATIGGPAAKADWEELTAIGITARINEKVVATSHSGSSTEHPLDALAWLALKLTAEGRQINAGEVVATGSGTPILQVLPGQRLVVDVEAVGEVSCSFR